MGGVESESPGKAWGLYHCNTVETLKEDRGAYTREVGQPLVAALALTVRTSKEMGRVFTSLGNAVSGAG